MKDMKNSNPINRKPDKTLLGMIFVLLGLILLLRSLNIFFFAPWIVSFPMALLSLGVFLGLKLDFKRPIAFIPIIIGSIFLIEEIIPKFDAGDIFWPVMIITLGFWMILGRKKTTHNNPIINPINSVTESIKPNQEIPNQENKDNYSFTGERIDSTSMFGGIKKNIVSKNFQGGDILNFFGGSEINLLQADISGMVKINVVQVFGGTKIIVPSNWTIQSEMLALLGGIEDKRPTQAMANPDKILVIQGTSIFGGIDIKSY
jgi:predicted membrane protein